MAVTSSGETSGTSPGMTTIARTPAPTARARARSTAADSPWLKGSSMTRAPTARALAMACGSRVTRTIRSSPVAFPSARSTSESMAAASSRRSSGDSHLFSRCFALWKSLTGTMAQITLHRLPTAGEGSLCEDAAGLPIPHEQGGKSDANALTSDLVGERGILFVNEEPINHSRIEPGDASG